MQSQAADSGLRQHSTECLACHRTASSLHALISFMLWGLKCAGLDFLWTLHVVVDRGNLMAAGRVSRVKIMSPWPNGCIY